MPYVLGFDHDLFLSYAHTDSAEWIRALEQSLRQQLRERLGADVDIWQDTNNIRFGQNWPDEINNAIWSAAAFLAVISPGYRTSEWCGGERKTFLDPCKAGNQLQAGSFYRFLKLVKLPWPGNAHEKFHHELQHIDFFERHSGTGVEVELTPGTNEFRARVADAASAIAALLVEMRRRRESVFVAAATPDCSKVRSALRAELRALGYDVRPDGPIDDGFGDDLIKEDIQPAILSAHLLGGVYDPFVDHQIDLAVELGKRLVFWFTPEALTTQDQRQRSLVESVRLGKRQQGQWSLLTNASPRANILDLLGMLRPQAVNADAKVDSGLVYLLCDPTTPEDADFARQLQEDIGTAEGLRVEVPLAESPGVSARPDLHQKLLREADGLLLYRKVAPERWLYQTLPEVVYAERLYQRPQLRSKGFLLNDASVLQGFSGVPLFLQSPEFSLKDIEPFLAPLRERGTHVTG
jgi:hypothetical protein